MLYYLRKNWKACFRGYFTDVLTEKNQFSKIICSLIAGFIVLGSLSMSAKARNVQLYDIGEHWAQNEILDAVKEGWIDGYPNGTFCPEGTVTRAEFTKMLLAAMNLKPDSQNALEITQHAYENMDFLNLQPFNDMNGHWLTTNGWTKTAIGSGMLVGSDYENLCFQPSVPITRYQIAVMVDRAMGLVYAAENSTGEKLSFSDEKEMPSWIKGYVWQAVEAGVLKGYPDGSFGGNRTATRAEAVVMIQRSMKYIREGISTELPKQEQIEIRIKFSKNPYDVNREYQYEEYDDIYQIVDGTVYLDLIHLKEQMWLCYHLGVTEDTEGYGWAPIKQILSFQFGNATRNFQVGKTLTSKPEGTKAVIRLLDGKAMLPVYDLVADSCFDNTWCTVWEEESRTLTIEGHWPAWLQS